MTHVLAEVEKSIKSVADSKHSSTKLLYFLAAIRVGCLLIHSAR